MSRLQDEGFKTDIVNRANAAPRGIVFEQRPSASHGAGGGKHRNDPRRRPGPPRSWFRTPSGFPSSRLATGWRARASRYGCSRSSRTSRRARSSPRTPDRASACRRTNSVRLNVSKGSGLVDVPSTGRPDTCRGSSAALGRRARGERLRGACRSSRRERSSRRTLWAAGSARARPCASTCRPERLQSRLTTFRGAPPTHRRRRDASGHGREAAAWQPAVGEASRLLGRDPVGPERQRLPDASKHPAVRVAPLQTALSSARTELSSV